MPQDNRMMTGATMTPNEMARENIPPNMDMGLESMPLDMDAINEVRLLMDLGLNPQDAMEAVVRKRAMGTVRPEEFGGQQMQAPMPRPQTMGGQQMPQQLGALPQMPPQAPPPRPVQRMDSDRTQDMEMQKFNMGT